MTHMPASPAFLAALPPGRVLELPGGAQASPLPDGRLHLNHGPIDLILQAWGDAGAVRHGMLRAIDRFHTILPELCTELPELRAERADVKGPIAQVMAAAVAPFRPAFITPMAAVAGAVAEAVLAELAQPGVTRAYVNNGGDIALHLTPGESLTCRIAARPGEVDLVRLGSCDRARGIATSGWRGRSWSFGIADSVTVAAKTAAMADAGATMIANAVNLPDHPAILRAPARDLQADSDLGDRLVTVDVGPLTQSEKDQALAKGGAYADRLQRAGLIEGAALFLQGAARTTGLMFNFLPEGQHV